MFVKPDAVLRQMHVFRLGISDAGVKIIDVLNSGNLFQCEVQLFAEPHFSSVFSQVDGGFSAVLIGGASDKSVRVGISADFPVFFRRQARIFLLYIFYTILKFIYARNFILKGYRCLFHIGGVNIQKCGNVFPAGDTDSNIGLFV